MIERPGVFYNSEIRNNGTARRVTETLFRMNLLADNDEEKGTRYSRPFFGEPNLSAHDFFLFIDDGRDEIPQPKLPSLVPSACWLIDTHLGYEKRLEWAKLFDFVFVCHPEAVERLEEDGIENVRWLPMACLPCVDSNASELRRLPPEQLGEWGLRKLHDVIFVGYLNTGHQGEGNNRIDYLHEVYKAFPNSWFAFNLFFEQAALRYARGRVGFNISLKNDLNMRFFETLSYGVCLVTNRNVDGWKELGFEEGKHFLGYEGIEEAKVQIKWALDNPMKREEIAKAGHLKVRESHTYEHRLLEMFDIVTTNDVPQEAYYDGR